MNLTYRQAAQRVRRSIRTVNRWRKAGMPMGWDTRDGQHVRVVEEQVLLAWWRERMLADPVYRARVRLSGQPSLVEQFELDH